jgi:proline iminopeptidase
MVGRAAATISHLWQRCSTIPPNLGVNAQVNRSWKQYIQRPSLLKEVAHLDRPALFLYGEQDIRPSWPIEQVTQLLPNASLQMIAGADHHIWVRHAEEMRARLRDVVQQIAQEEAGWKNQGLS